MESKIYRILEIKPSNFVSCVSWSTKSGHDDNLTEDFDKQILSAWNDALQKGFFRYKLNIRDSSVIPGRWKFYVQLNPERGELRREPQRFYSVCQDFNTELFNFTKIKEGEVMFELKVIDDKFSIKKKDQDLLTINISPINEGHSLIIPCVNRRYPQALTQRSIELGLHLLLSSSSPSFRIVFNSLCGMASVNHLHLHGLYIDKPMMLESIELQELGGPCFQLNTYPGRGFAFQCQANRENDVKDLARHVHKLTDFLLSRNEAHNVIMTRSKADHGVDQLSWIRVYVWVRKLYTGAKSVFGFNPAALELFGYFNFKDVEKFENVCEESICKILEDLTHEPFERNCNLIKQLFLE